MLKKIILLFISIIVSLFLVEVLFHLLNYKIKIDEVSPYFNLFGDRNEDKIKFMKDHYIEIYDDFFIENNGYYVKQRSSIIDIGTQEFKKNKDNDVKRIFIVGESVAAIYNVDLLQKNLGEFISNKKFEIINAGMGSYDSYRIEKILKEISSNYNPDYIIMMVGNNDGHLHNPVMINYLPYKYKIFRKSYVLNAISNLVMPRYKYGMSNVFSFFKHNIEKMIKDVNGKCPMIFVTLPRDEKSDNYIFEERRNFIRTLPNKYKSVYVSDFDKILRTFIKKPKYDVFTDIYGHYNDVFYDLISKLIICKIDKNIDNNLMQNINKEYIVDLLEKDIDFKFSYVKKDIKEYDFSNFIEYIKKIDIDIDNFNDEYRTDLLEDLHFVYRLYKDYYGTVTSNEKMEETVNVLENMIEKYCEKEATYIFKALFYFKIGNKELFEENINIALKINPNIVKKLK